MRKINRFMKDIAYLEDKGGVGHLNVVFLRGRLYDDKHMGLANFASGVLEEGVDDEYVRELERRGIVLECKAGLNTLSIKLVALSEHFGYGVRMLKTLLLRPNTSAKTINKVKNNIISLVEYNQSDFGHLAKVGFDECYFGSDDFVGGIIGDRNIIASMDKITLDGYFASLLDSPCMVVAGGQIDHAALDELKSILNLQSFTLKQYTAQNPFVLSKIDEQTQQAYIHFGAKLTAKSSEYAPLKIASFILGEGSFGSRLVESVRVQNGLAYSVYGFMDISENYSRLYGGLQTKCQNAQKAINLVKDEIKEFFDKGVSADEYQSAVKFLKGSYVLRYESVSKRMDIRLLEMIRGLDDGYYKRLYQSIDKTSLDEVNEFIKSHAVGDVSFFALNNESI